MRISFRLLLLAGVLLAGTGLACAADRDSLGEGATRVTCRVVSADEPASRVLCIQGLPRHLCTEQTPWPLNGAIRADVAGRCAASDCVLNAEADSASTTPSCAGIQIQPRRPGARRPS